MVDGSVVILIVLIVLFLLPRVPRSPTASLGPRNTFTLRASRLVRLLLGAPFPVPSLSCFSLLYETVGTAAGTVLQGSCHWFVIGELAGLSFSIFDSPLVGSVPSCCWCFTLRCLFSLALRYWLTLLLHSRYWLTLLLHSPLFHIQITSKFSTSPHNRHYMPRLKVCFLTVLRVRSHNASHNFPRENDPKIRPANPPYKEPVARKKQGQRFTKNDH